MNQLIKSILVIGGSISIGMGVLGIFLPLLPTTPFLLLGAACYVKGSPRCYQWLISNRHLGKYIESYRNGGGIPVRAKILSISLLWLSIGFSSIYIIDSIIVRILLLSIAGAVTYHITSIKTRKT